MGKRNTLRAVAAAGAILMAVAGCGSDTPSDTGGGTGGSTEGCDLKLGFFGALTGDAANLGINIEQGAKLAIDQYNTDNADCQVTLADYDSQGNPDQAPALAQQAINDEAVVGIIGPAFSGESKAADPLFDEAGLPLISASATATVLSTNGWTTFHRILGNDNSQGPSAATYISDVLAPDQVFVVDDASEYGKGLADIVKDALGDVVVGSDQVQQGQTDFSATVTAIRSSGATVLFFGGYYAEGGLLRKQLSDAGGQDVTMVVGDGVKDPGFVEAAGAAAAEGTIMTCPCLPPDATGGTFADDYQAAFGDPPGTYSAEAFDAANVFLAAIADGKTTRADINDFVTSYEGDGITKSIKFDDTGEITDIVVWAYKVEGGEIVPDQEIAQSGS